MPWQLDEKVSFNWTKISKNKTKINEEKLKSLKKLKLIKITSTITKIKNIYILFFK